MKVSYKKLWLMCVEKDISKGELRKLSGPFICYLYKTQTKPGS